ncbi:MAG TPA: hypothetical protein VGV09_02345 [Steroidobacteraceae bacterium]|nr:hypothetical protein [Steroidobacteraceae bacterium]
MILSKRSAAAAAPIAVFCLLVGCATATKPEAMVADKVAVAHPSSSDVSVAVSGGKETSSAGASQVSNDAFAQALRDSIKNSGLFSAVNASGGRYKLTAFIGKMDQPMMGFSMTVKMEVSYTLADSRSNQSVWSKNIASEYTAKASAAFAGVERLRLATEGAAKANIQQAMTELAALQL